MERRKFIRGFSLAGIASLFSFPVMADVMLGNIKGEREDKKNKRKEISDRNYWIEMMLKLGEPILANFESGTFKKNFPVLEGREYRQKYVALEAFSRWLVGASPWLDLGEDETTEGQLRGKYIKRVRQCLANLVNPEHPDYGNFSDGDQCLCDSSILAISIYNAKNELWLKQDDQTKKNIVAALKASRKIKPFYNNWVLFSPVIETVLYWMGEDWDEKIVDISLRQIYEWYIGDGMFKDGVEFKYDYYNSFVIQPHFWHVLSILKDKGNKNYEDMYEMARKATVRYSDILERLISPEGTYPPTGRSITYRFGIFHLLSQTSLQKRLPQRLKPAQVRSALTAVIKRQMEAKGTFDVKGWLMPGLVGHQPSLAEVYISKASGYYCCHVFQPLGLPANDPFWADPSMDWTTKLLWNGVDMNPDQSIDKICIPR